MMEVTGAMKTGIAKKKAKKETLDRVVCAIYRPAKAANFTGDQGLYVQLP